MAFNHKRADFLAFKFWIFYHFSASLMHYLNFFWSCSVKNLTSASVSRLFTIQGDVIFPF